MSRPWPVRLLQVTPVTREVQVNGPRCQRRGLGTATLNLIVEYFRNRGVGTMWTSVGQGEGSPLRFYERYGFKQTGDFHDNEILLRLEIS